ncbi:amino acid transporter, partial [Vibrio vulnificus]
LPMWGFPYLSWLTLALIAAVFVLGFTDAQVAIQLLSTIGLTAGIAILSWIGLKLSDKTKK